MRKVILGLVILACSICGSAQKISLRAVGSGKVSVIKGGLRSLIDLSTEVAGCAAVAQKFRRELETKGCAASPATLKLIDSVTKNNQNFLVVQSEAMGNCNVCGQCGVSEAFSLIWLKLDARLRVIEKKSVPIEYCLGNISIVGSTLSFDEEKQDSALSLKFINDVLTVEYEKKLFSDTSDIFGYDFSHLEYNRKTPEKGFAIKTEKRAQSSEN